MNDVNISAENAMKQAGMTAEDYLSTAYNILKDEYEDWSVRDAIELAKVMAQDFHTTMMIMKIQEIRDEIMDLSIEVKDMRIELERK